MRHLRMRHAAAALLPALVLLAPCAAAQQGEPAAAQAGEPAGAPVAAEEPWVTSLSTFYSDPPGSEDRLTLVAYADRGPLHLEFRYNYEDLETGSLWGGWNLEYTADEVEIGVTPMLGVVAGETDGIAPGFELDVGWRKLAWYAEAEYLFDSNESDDSYFYCWSTLTYALTESLSAGVVTERSRIVDTDHSVQRGLAVEFASERISVALYAYNLFESDDSYAVLALGVGF